MALVTWVSRHWTAEQALNTYAALAWMGDNRHGVIEGSAFLFGKDVNELSLAETALLVVTIRSPRSLSPLCRPERALEARNDLLQRLGRAGIADGKEIAASLASPLGVRGHCTAPR
jgi:membrane peptidoglycan carboxypeptidase